MFLSGDSLLEVEGLWKRFPRTPQARRSYARQSLAWPIFGRRPGDSLSAGEFWALRDVSFQLRRGDAIGVLGLNGSGKSTLLSILAGYLLPDRGRVASMGRLSAFINLASGMKGGLSGRENIHLRSHRRSGGASLSKADFETIVDFAELGEFIDAPVSTYSSGMRMRLAFSIAIHDEPDILLVDEVLSVGDFRFKQKCLARIQQLKKNCSFVLVSHSMADVSRFCDRALVLDRGHASFLGEVEPAIKSYLEQQDTAAGANLSRAATSRHVEPTYNDEGAIVDLQFEINGQAPGEVVSVGCDDGLELIVRFRAGQRFKHLVVGVPIHREHGEVMTAFSTESSGLRLAPRSGEQIALRLQVPRHALNPGAYRLIIAITEGPQFVYRSIACDLRVRAERALSWGHYTPAYQWEREV